VGAIRPAEATGSAGRLTPAQAGLDLAALGAALALLLFLFPASRAAGPELFGRVLLPARMAALVLLASLLLWRRGGGWRALGLRRPRPLWRALLLAAAGLVAGELAAGAVVSLLYPPLHLAPPGVPPFLARMRGNLGAYLYWMIPVTWGSAAFGEEMLFRGFALDRLDQLFGGRAAWAAAAVQGLLFGAAHAYLGASGAIVAGVLGLVLGAVFLVGGRNLWPCVLIHGVIDSTSMTIIFLGLAHR
jgi:membrane protease YdiL (CAAX protease family)